VDHQEDTFILTLPNVGRLNAVTVESDGGGAEPDWMLSAVEVEVVSTGTSYFFPCDAWLSATKADRRLARWLPAVDPQQYQASYKVEGALGLGLGSSVLHFIVSVHNGSMALLASRFPSLERPSDANNLG
jgi:hypothetical protein